MSAVSLDGTKVPGDQIEDEEVAMGLQQVAVVEQQTLLSALQ